jgi:predicted nucleic acid-binding protein
MNYLIDSSAWIEYLNGSSAGEEVNKVLKGKNDIFVISQIISEVVSKVEREKGNSELAYTSIISNASIMEITPKIAKQAGLLHADLRRKSSSISLADTLIIVSARTISAKIITKDRHFKGFKEATILK